MAAAQRQRQVSRTGIGIAVILPLCSQQYLARAGELAIKSGSEKGSRRLCLGLGLCLCVDVYCAAFLFENRWCCPVFVITFSPGLLCCLLPLMFSASFYYDFYFLSFFFFFDFFPSWWWWSIWGCDYGTVKWTSTQHSHRQTHRYIQPWDTHAHSETGTCNPHTKKRGNFVRELFYFRVRVNVYCFSFL